MKRLILATFALLAITVGGCSAIGVASDASNKPVEVQTVDDARNIIYAVKSGYGALLIATTAYVNLPACEKPGAPAACSNRAAVIQLSKAQAAASATINNAEEAVLRTRGNETSYLSAAIRAARAAYESYKAVATAYNVGGPL